MAARGRPPGQGKVPGSGRVKGKSLDKGARQLVSAELAGSILTTFERLGGVDDMVEWAEANRTTFYTQVLSRLFPAPQRDDPDVQVNTQVNIGVDDDFEAARRIAFALAKATHEQEQLPPVMEAVRVTRVHAEPEPKPWVPPPAAAPVPQLQPEPVEPLDHERQRWFEELPLTPEQRADRQLVRETRECSIETYRGGPGEQYDAVCRPSSNKPSAGDRRRAVMSRRGRDLL